MKKSLIIGGVALVVVVLAIVLWAREPATSPVEEAGTSTESGDGTLPSSGGQMLEPKSGGEVFVPAPVDARGRAIFAITDAPTNLGLVKSVFITIQKIEVQGPKKGWVVVSTAPKTFDVLELKRSGSFGVLADVSLEAEEYNQLRFSVSGVQVVHNDGAVSVAKLPSGVIRVTGLAPVQANKTSSAVIDFDLERSLILTAEGRYLFAPVVKLLTRTSVVAELTQGNKVRFSSGSTQNQYSVGMDENGSVKENFMLDPLSRFELLGETLKIVPQGMNEDGVIISAEKAIDIARTAGGLPTALSVKLVLSGNAKAWQVSGMKNGALSSVVVHAETGAILP